MFRTFLSMCTFSVVATVSVFTYQSIGTHITSVDNFGIFSSWLTDIGYVGLIFILGLDNSLLYFNRLGDKIEENMGRNIVIYSSIYFLLSIIVVLFFRNSYVYYLTLLTSVYILALLNIIKIYFQYNEKFLLYNIVQISNPVITLIAFFIFLFSRLSLSSNYILLVYTCCLIITLLLVIIFLKTKVVIRFSYYKSFIKKEYFKYGIKSIFNNLLSILLYASCILMLRIMSSYESIAYFFIASAISKSVWLLPDSAGNLLYPVFLKRKNIHDDIKAQELMFRYGGIITLINLFILFVFIILGKSFIGALYQPSYIKAFLPTVILLIGNQGMVYYKFISRYLASDNRWRPLYLSLSSALLVNITLNVILIPKYDIIGAAISSCLSFWTCGIILSIYVKNSFFNILNIYTAAIYFFKEFRLKSNV